MLSVDVAILGLVERSECDCSAVSTIGDSAQGVFVMHVNRSG